MKIVVLDGYCVNPGDLSWSAFEKLGECVVYDRTAPKQIVERAEDADALIINKAVITEDMMRQLPQLKYIGVLATGYNVVDLEGARQRQIVVTNIPAYGTESVAQMVFAHILNILNSVSHYADECRNFAWTKQRDFCYWNTPLNELFGKKLGIVGFGNTGRAVARIAKAFGMTVYVYTSRSLARIPAGFVKADLGVLFRECDIVSLHCPLHDDNRGMVNAALLGTMKPTAIFINTARGGLVCQQDLADALNERKLYAAGLDVLSTEPPTADNPLLTARNCFITPHIAWATIEARQRLMTKAMENLTAFVKGNPINVVS